VSEFEIDGSRVMSRRELLDAGFTSKGITRAVRSGHLIRLRRDHYIARTDPAADAAVRIGGVLTCISALTALGVFAVSDGRVHVHVERTMSRLRGPVDRRERWDRRVHGSSVRLHWGRSPEWASREAVSLDEAIRTMVRCRAPREVVAALDSILYLGIRSREELHEIFACLPRKYEVLLRLADGRAESGPESLVRLMLRQLGAAFDLQVVIGGVGRVDFLIGDRLILECDSKAHHSDWGQRRKDIRRDQEAARRGYTTVRLLAEDVLFRPAEVMELLADLVAAHA
jgi:very-short-patch-repair endonuclease